MLSLVSTVSEPIWWLSQLKRTPLVSQLYAKVGDDCTTVYHVVLGGNCEKRWELSDVNRIELVSHWYANGMDSGVRTMRQ